MTTQLKKGIIELCVLKLISDTPSSGVVIIEKINHMLKVSENTVYPILRRLSEKGLFQTHTEKSDFGAPKKVYTITFEGIKQLESGLNDWKEFMTDVTHLLGGNYDKK